MKITAILLIAAFLLASARLYSQVTLSEKNLSLHEVFSKIRQQTGYDFLYNTDVLQGAGNIDIQIKNASLQEALALCLKNKPLTYFIIEKTVIIRPKEQAGVQEQRIPSIEIRGKVVNENGEPVVGASVQVKGTNTGTSTDTSGGFQLWNVKEKATIVISAINIETVETAIRSKTSLTITAKTKEAVIDEIQIIGYGTTTRRLHTGSIATIKGIEIRDRPVTNVLQTLQGKLPGVIVQTPVGGIGSPSLILIRGTNSITSGNNPLLIVDGIIMNDNPGGLLTATTSNGGSNTYQMGNSPLNFVNPNDIESIDVLKDADATSIYGSRGTNGVLLITTKKPTLGKTKIQFNSSLGWKNAIGITKRMNTEQYLQMRKDAFATGNMTAGSVINPITPNSTNAPDLVTWNQAAYTDYPRFELNNPAPSYSADVNVTGGTKKLNYISSASYYKIYDTYLFNPYQERMTGRAQMNSTSANNKLNITLGSIFGIEKQQFTTTHQTLVYSITNSNAPNFELYKSDGNVNFGVGQGYLQGMYYNPLPNKNLESKAKTYNLLLNGDLSYSIIKNLVAKLQVSHHSQNNEYHQLYPSTAVNIQNVSFPNPYGWHTTNKYSSFNFEPQLTYTHYVAKARISLLTGATVLNKKIERSSAKVNNPGSDDLLYSFASGRPTEITSNNIEQKFNSVFARLNADWDKKYIANISFRRDGSSRLGPNNRYANFGSVGLGWIFTNESFFKDRLAFLNYGKLRGSYGTTGNDNILDYQYLSLLQSPITSVFGSYNGISGLNPVNYANPNIRWETTKKRDIGIELGFFKNRMLLTATWYRSISTDLLVSLPLPSQTGFTSYIGNFPGKVQNSGFEFDLTTRNLNPKSSLQWTTKFNITSNQNILKAFPNIEQTIYASLYQVGRALPSTYYNYVIMEMPYKLKEIDPSNGLPVFVDVNKDDKVDPNDSYTNASWIGSATPTLWGGLTNNVSYKGFTLNVFLHFTNGIFSKWNFGGQLQNPIGSIFNPSTDVVGNYWMKPGDVKKYPRLYTNVPGAAVYIDPITKQYPLSDALLYKGYYVRLKNVEVSYSLPQSFLSKIKFESGNVYLSGENLAVFVPEKLYKDPETVMARSIGLLRTIAVGIRVSF